MAVALTPRDNAKHHVGLNDNSIKGLLSLNEYVLKSGMTLYYPFQRREVYASGAKRTNQARPHGQQIPSLRENNTSNNHEHGKIRWSITCIEKEDCRTIITHYKDVSVIYAFNFSIGACAVILPPNRELPNFVEDKADSDTVQAMLDYTSGYSKFWNIPGNYWVDNAIKWVGTPEVSTSIGEHSMTAMIAHLLVAIVADNKVKNYPKFYISSIANDVN